MSESNTDTGAADDGHDDDEQSTGLDRTLADGLTVHLEMLESGEIKVRFLEETDADGVSQIFTSKEKSDFYTKRQTRRTIANAVADNVDGMHKTQAKDEVLDFFNELAAADEETQEAFRHPTVNNVIEATQGVEVFGGEPTTWSVEIDWNQFAATIEFTHSEWVKDGAHTFKEKFNQAFFETPRLENDDWQDLREMWEDQAEVIGVERTTSAELIAEDVMETLKTRINCYEDREKLRDDKWSAWFDIENSAGRSEAPYETDVLWVKTSAIKEALDDAGKDAGFLSQLSKELKKGGYTHASSTSLAAGTDNNGDKVQQRCYPFEPAALGKTQHSIVDLDPEEEDDGDGDDDGEQDSSGGDDDGDGGDRPDGKEVVPDGGWVPEDDENEGCRVMTDGGQPVDAPDDRAEVVKLNGAPGCGKTYTLFQYVEEERDEYAREFPDVLFCTFTRSGQAEAEQEMVQAFSGTTDDIKKRAKTVHGAALSAALVNDGLQMPPDSSNLDNVIIYDMQQDAHVYRQFCEQEGLSFTPEETNPLKMVRDGQDLDTTGNRLFGIYQWLKLERKPLRKFIEAPVGLPIDDARVLELLESWEEFKQTNFESPKYEHVDYVDLCIDNEYVPETEVLFIDEFQDLSPQEYLLYKVWRDSGQIDRIYIAGDQNQSIYSFRAGTPWYFKDTPVDREEYVTESYRCPSSVVDVGREALEACSETDPQGFSAKFDGGTATRVSLEDSEDLGAAVKNTLDQYDGDESTPVYLLARTNYHVGRIASALNESGVPYKELSGKMDPWDETLTQTLTVLRALKDDRNVPQPALDKLLATNIAGWKQRRQTLKMMDGVMTGDFYRPGSVWEAFPDCETVRDIASLVDVTDYQREMLMEAVETTVAPDPGRVKVGTIHASKGSEAPHVYLFNAASKRIYDEYLRGETHAEEHRVTYVGATRASDALYIVEDFFDGYPLPGLDADRGTGGIDEEVFA